MNSLTHPGSLLPGPLLLSLTGLKFAHPRALYLLAAVALVLGWSLWQAGALRKFGAPVLRAIVIALFVIALAEPQIVIHSEGTTRPALVDVSGSITPSMRAYAINLLRDRLKYRAGDPMTIFGAAPVDTTVGAAARQLQSPGGCAACAPGGTNLEAALDKLAADPEAHDGPVVLVTDGWQNRGDADAAVGALRAAGITLDIFTPPGALSIPNVAMDQLILPPTLAKAEPFALGVTMTNLNAKPVEGTVSLYRNGQLLEDHTVTLSPGQSRYDFPVRAESAGLVSYRADFKASNPALDAFPEDNSLQGWVGVGAQRKVLILTGNSRDARYLETTVRRSGLEPTVVSLADREFDGNARGYDAVILNNVPRARLSPAAQSALVEYAADGGSLAMVGGDASFGLGGYEQGPIASAMPVVMKPPQRHERTRALVLIIDKSGSMGRNNKLVYAKAAALTVTKTLNATDLVAVIGFDSQPFVVIPLQPLSQSRPYFSEVIDRIKARGTTYLLPAMQEAERMLSQNSAAIKHVVILTDGETGGTASMYYDLVSSMHHQAGVTISAVAIGEEANVALLEAITKYGGGGFYQTDSPANLPEIFLQDVRQRTGDTTMVEKAFVPYSVRPDPVLKDLAGRQFPALKGFVATDLKPGAHLSLFVNSQGQRAPIIASWKFSNGKTLAMTTDASGRWSSAWVENGVFTPLWDNLLAWMTPQTAGEQKFDVALGYHSGRIDMTLTDYSENLDASGRPINVRVTGPDGAKFEAILSQEAPGELAGSIDAPKPGTYYIELKSLQGKGKETFNQTFPPLAYTVSAAVNAELPRPEPNYNLLEQLASATGGRLNPSPQELAMTRPEFERSTPETVPFVVAAMLLLIAEALLRRLTF